MDRIDVLIVDDEPFVVRSLSYVFQREGFSFDVAMDGDEAVEKARRLLPKIMFLDIMMPKKTGYDVCEQVKRDLQAQAPYIIMLTAKGQKDDKVKSLSAGANDYVAKPFSPQFVVNQVKEVLERLG